MTNNEYFFILGQLYVEWQQARKLVPSARFGQHVMNSERVKDIVKPPCPEVFYDEDDQRVMARLIELAPK